MASGNANCNFVQSSVPMPRSTPERSEVVVPVEVTVTTVVVTVTVVMVVEVVVKSTKSTTSPSSRRSTVVLVPAGRMTILLYAKLGKERSTSYFVVSQQSDAFALLATTARGVAPVGMYPQSSMGIIT